MHKIVFTSVTFVRRAILRGFLPIFAYGYYLDVLLFLKNDSIATHYSFTYVFGISERFTSLEKRFPLFLEATLRYFDTHFRVFFLIFESCSQSYLMMFFTDVFSITVAVNVLRKISLSMFVFLGHYAILLGKGAIHKGCSHQDGREDGSQKQTGADTGKMGQPNVNVRIEKNDFRFFITIWKYFMFNINLIFQYNVRNRIRLECKVYPSRPSPLPPPTDPTHTHTHTHPFHILSVYFYLMVCPLE